LGFNDAQPEQIKLRPGNHMKICRYSGFFLFTFATLSSSLIAHAAYWYSGIEVAQHIKKQPITIPDTLSVQRAATCNGTGYIFYIVSPIAHEFIKNEAVPQKTVLEIGAGFSNVALEALKNGVHRYVANDLSLDHLKILVARIQQSYPEQADELLQHLVLVHAKAPHELPVCENSYDALLLDKVFHFMNPTDIEAFIVWAYTALKPQGKIYILTISPYIASLQATIAPLYHAQQAAGNLFPGYITNIHAHMQEILDKNPSYIIPEELTFFTREDLEQLFLRKNFRIERSYSLRLPSPSQEQWEVVPDVHGDLVALIASKHS
jgi:ubiquinone/menaquinone biosynthesis C-methylase UbiE